MAELEALAARSPTVVDTFFLYRGLYEQRLPYFYFEGEMIGGPNYELVTTDGVVDASIRSGRMTFGGVPWTWSDQAGLRLGIDLFAIFLTPLATDTGGAAPSSEDRGWGYGNWLFYASAFDRLAGWSATAGLYLSTRPLLAQGASGLEFTYDEDGGHTEQNRPAAFFHATLPWAGLTTAAFVDAKGVRQLKGLANVAKVELWESLGPYVATFPQLDNYQLGAHATRLRAWEAPVTVSSEVAGRWESGDGVAFDHAVVSVELTLLADGTRRDASFRDEAFQTDFRIEIEAHGSYYNLASAKDWGGGLKVELASISLLSGEWSAGITGSYNSYQDIIVLPVSEVAMVRMILSGGW